MQRSFQEGERGASAPCLCHQQGADASRSPGPKPNFRSASVCLLLLALVAPLRAEEPKKTQPEHQVPYRLTDSKHVLVRAKINGKGPFNFIIDTGAPALYVSTAVCNKLKIEPDEKGWGNFDRFDVEGGVRVEKIKGRVEDPFQIEGINRLGLAGAELHGVIGYNLLAKYRITFDFTKDKLTWVPLDFDPPAPRGIGKQAGGVDAMGGMVKVLTALVGDQMKREVRLRGFLGVELTEKDENLIIAAVLPESPAAEAKLKPGEFVAEVDGKPTKTVVDLHKLIAGRRAGDTVQLSVGRVQGKVTVFREVKIMLGKGL